MKHLVLVMLICCGFPINVHGDNAKKIIGKWEMTEELNGVKSIITLDLTPDGKMKTQLEFMGTEH